MPLLHDLENGDINFSDLGKAVNKISKLITHHSVFPADLSVEQPKGKTNVMFMSDSLKMLKQLVLTARLHLSLGRITIILMEMALMKIIVLKRREYRFKLRNFLSQLEAEKSPNFAMQQTLMRSFFGGS